MMRSFVSRFAASAAFAIAVLTSFGATAQPAAEPPVTCAALSAAEPAKVIEACTALIDNPATPEGDRLDATITRAAALHNSGQTAKALVEIDTVISKDPNRARAFRARGEILRQTGKMDESLPIILFDKAFWRGAVNLDHLAETGMIHPDDLKLFGLLQDFGYVKCFEFVQVHGLKPA
jgi:hypothetical protein